MSDRRSLLARVHILKKELGLADPEYRALLRNFGTVSSASLTEDDLARLAGTMEGMKSDRSDRSGNRKKTSRKIWAVWYELKTYLPSGKRSADYLAGIARRNAPDLAMINGSLDFDAVTGEQADGIIRSLLHAVNYEKARLAADVPF